MSKPPSRMTKEELRAELLSRNYAPEQLDQMDRQKLKELFLSHREGEGGAEALGTAVEEEEESGANGGAASGGEGGNAPKPTDPGWSQYVLGQFVDGELDGQNPRMEGLRRVAERLVGEIAEEGCDLLSPPTLDNGNRACVKAWVKFKLAGVNSYRRFEALADVSPENCDDEYAKFPTSMAETRAKGRCYRAALRLSRVIAAEEAGGANIPLGAQGGSEVMIQMGQISAIQIMSDRLKVSIPAVLEHLEIKKADLRALTHTEAMLVVKNLNTYQQMGIENIPSKLKRA